MSFKRRALWIFIAGFVIDFIGFVLHVTGMATPEWSTLDSDNTRGVFRSCSAGDCSSNSDPNTDVETVMAMTIISIILIMVAIILALVHIMLEVLDGEPIKSLPLIAGCFSIGAFFINLIGVIVWGAVVHSDLEDANGDYKVGFSLPLSLVGGVLFAIGGVLLLLGDTFICTSEKKLLDK